MAPRPLKSTMGAPARAHPPRAAAARAAAAAAAPAAALFFFAALLMPLAPALAQDPVPIVIPTTLKPTSSPSKSPSASPTFRPTTPKPTSSPSLSPTTPAPTFACTTDGGHARQDSGCIFPFTFSGIAFNDCANIGQFLPWNKGKAGQPAEKNTRSDLWCATSSTYATGKKATRANWGYCNCAVFPTMAPTTNPTNSAPSPTPGPTLGPTTPSATPTVAPTRNPTPGPTTSPTYGTDFWSQCQAVGGGKKGRWGQCTFPFKFGGVTYNECVNKNLKDPLYKALNYNTIPGGLPEGNSKLWCSTVAAYSKSTEKNWGFCACPVFTEAPSHSPNYVPPPTPVPTPRLPGVYTLLNTNKKCKFQSSYGLHDIDNPASLEVCQEACDERKECWRLLYSKTKCRLIAEPLCKDLAKGGFAIYTRAPGTPPPSTGAPTEVQTKSPSKSPSVAAAGTDAPTKAPTKKPTSAAPTDAPSPPPTKAPTSRAPSASPTFKPTATGETRAPTASPSAAPTSKPTAPTAAPTPGPTAGATAAPSAAPTDEATAKPSAGPTLPVPSSSEYLLLSGKVVLQPGEQEPADLAKDIRDLVEAFIKLVDPAMWRGGIQLHVLVGSGGGKTGSDRSLRLRQLQSGVGDVVEFSVSATYSDGLGAGEAAAAAKELRDFLATEQSRGLLEVRLEEVPAIAVAVIGADGGGGDKPGDGDKPVGGGGDTAVIIIAGIGGGVVGLALSAVVVVCVLQRTRPDVLPPKFRRKMAGFSPRNRRLSAQGKTDKSGKFSDLGPLPSGWTEHFDQNAGRCYYFNKRTQTTTWTHPGGVVRTPSQRNIQLAKSSRNVKKLGESYKEQVHKLDDHSYSTAIAETKR